MDSNLTKGYKLHTLISTLDVIILQFLFSLPQLDSMFLTQTEDTWPNHVHDVFPLSRWWGGWKLPPTFPTSVKLDEEAWLTCSYLTSCLSSDVLYWTDRDLAKQLMLRNNGDSWPFMVHGSRTSVNSPCNIKLLWSTTLERGQCHEVCSLDM